MFVRSLLLVICFSFTLLSWGQVKEGKEPNKAYDSSGKRDYALYPWWIEMMNDSAANYFEVQKAFNTFWTGKKLPVREENEVRPIHDPANQETPPIDTKWVAEVKTYQAWVRFYEYLHEEDGTIFPPSRMIAEWERQIKERGKQ